MYEITFFIVVMGALTGALLGALSGALGSLVVLAMASSARRVARWHARRGQKSGVLFVRSSRRYRSEFH